MLSSETNQRRDKMKKEEVVPLMKGNVAAAASLLNPSSKLEIGEASVAEKKKDLGAKFTVTYVSFEMKTGLSFSFHGLTLDVAFLAVP